MAGVEGGYDVLCDFLGWGEGLVAPLFQLTLERPRHTFGVESIEEAAKLCGAAFFAGGQFDDVHRFAGGGCFADHIGGFARN